MFNESIDKRLSAWAELRESLSRLEDPLQEVCDFWKKAPFVPYNKNVDPTNQSSWPTPWEIVVANQYDDFTKALMIGWTLKYSKLYEKSTIIIKTLIDTNKKTVYNVVCVDNSWVINYVDNSPVLIENLPESFLLENIIELEISR
jgi:hypothetical protein